MRSSSLSRSTGGIRLSSLGILLALAGLVPNPASAATYYQLNLGSYTKFSSDPVAHDTTFYESVPSVYDAELRCAGLATARRASPFTRITSSTQSINHIGSSTTSAAQASTDDFLITGPAGPTSVAGTLYFRVAAILDFEGGYPGPDPFFIEESHFYFSVIAAQVYQEYGGYTHANSASYSGGYGPLASTTGSSFDVVFPLNGTFPVGTPFSVELNAQAGGGTQLEAANSPASISADGGGVNPWANRLGLWLGDDTGHVMDLPPGYTVSSPDWGVTNGTTAVADELVDVTRMRVRAAPNPFTTGTQISFAVASAGRHQLVVVDLAGRVVRTLHSGWSAPGWHQASWDGRDASGQPAPLGIYFAVLGGAQGMVSHRVVLVR